MKRVCDILISSLLIVILFPIMIIVGVIIFIDDGAPVIFSQERVGFKGKVFRIYKFRTMKKTSPKYMPSANLQNPYSYMTRTGRFIRASSLDELPQLINILKGDMSLVGPRPLIVREKTLHKLREKNNVYSVRPGLTGWAQVNGRDCVNIVDKVKLDKEYVDNQSLLFDLKIMIKTFSVIFKKDGYSEGGEDKAKKKRYATTYEAPTPPSAPMPKRKKIV